MTVEQQQVVLRRFARFPVRHSPCFYRISRRTLPELDMCPVAWS